MAVDPTARLGLPAPDGQDRDVRPEPRPPVPTPGRGVASVGSPFDRFSVADVTAIRNLLRGGSVIDWHRLYFTDRAEVDRFLRVNEFDPDSELDMNRLEDLRQEAVEYVERHLDLR